MSATELLIHDRQTGRPMPLGGHAEVRVNSESPGWHGLALEEQRVAPTQTPECHMPWHWLSIGVPGPAGVRTINERHEGHWQTHRLAPDDVVFRPAGVPCTVAWHTTTHTINVAVDPTLTHDLGSVEQRCRLGNDPIAAALIRALHAEARSTDTARVLVVDGLRLSLTAHLTNTYTGTPRRGAHRTRPLTSAQIDQVHNYISAHMSEPLRVSDLAAVLALSPYHFARAFRAATATTPYHYVHEQRLRRACRLLRTTTVPVGDIAATTGFSDRAHLARHLRDRYGLNPTQLRHQPDTPARTATQLDTTRTSPTS